MSKLRKVSLALNPQLVDDLDYLTARLGVSRSAFVSEILTQAAADVRRLLEVIPESPQPADAVRFRGDSVEVVKQRLASLQQVLDGTDLFSGGQAATPSGSARSAKERPVCTCSVTPWERQENLACPVHNPEGRR